MSRSVPGNSANHILVPYNAAYDIANPLSISCWFHPTATTANRRIFSRCHSAANKGGYELMQGSTVGRLGVHVVATTFSGQELDSTNSFTAGVWNHGGGVVDTSTLAVFLNGVKTSAALGTSPGTNNTYGLGIGRYPDTAASNIYAGGVAEAAIWNVALSDAEMVALSKGISPAMIRRNALVVYYPLFGAGTAEADLAGLALNGTITGTVPQENHAPVGQLRPWIGG